MRHVRKVTLADLLATAGEYMRASNEFPGHDQRMAAHTARVLRESPESVGKRDYDHWRCPRCGAPSP